ncbi:hypothetical protein DV735_g3380, partial [Chaetothyriales sp. CBS 134920]
LKKLYRDLQFQRQIDVDTVRLNIERECRRGKVLKARLKRKVRAELQDAGQGVGRGRKRKHAMLDEDVDDDEGDGNDAVAALIDDEGDGNDAAGALIDDAPEMALDAKFFGPNGAVLPARSRRYHTTMSLLAAMEASIQHLEREIADLDGQSDEILREMNETVADLSDLQYGKSSTTSAGPDKGEKDVESEVVDALNDFTSTVNYAVRESKSAVT